MKKTFKMLAAGFIAVMLTAGAGLSAAACPVDTQAKTVSLSRIEDSTIFMCYPNLGADFLVSYRSVKNNLVVDYDETLVIPAGKKLVLNNGAHINGTLYIEKGGYLAVRGGSLIDCGNIICDGTISVGSNARLMVKEDATFVVTGLGTLKYSADTISLSKIANIACFGVLNAKYLTENEISYLLSSPVCAVTGIKGKEVYTDATILNGFISGMTDYYPSGTLTGSESGFVSLMLDNGSRIYVQQADSRTTSIGYVYVCGLKELSAEALEAAKNK